MIQTRSTNNGRLSNMEQLPAGGSQPSLCVAYLILSGTSGWALKATSSSATYAMGMFSFLLGHSVIGFLHTTHPNPGKIVGKIFRQTSILAEVAPLALLNAEFYLLTGFAKEYAYAHLASAFLPLVAQMAMKEHTTKVIDITVLSNLGSLLYLQIMKETGVWTGGLVALTALNHYVFKKLSSRYRVPKIEIVTVGLSFFTIFSMNCLRDLKA